ncbi:hypothetical protein [Deinococcus sonorensis]|uniref:Pyruvate carboxyltransferase domain-containing protein n=2 Tax=Deinococcus sonorensis TaxID=309891 RepID=A0AAU7U7F5_9DEIO
MTDTPRRIHIFDPTLRDGSPSPGVALHPAQKHETAHALERLGVDIIEAGFSIPSDGDVDCLTRIAREVRGPTIAPSPALEAAATRCLHVFTFAGAIHTEYMLRTTPDEVPASSVQAVKLACQSTDEPTRCSAPPRT